MYSKLHHITDYLRVILNSQAITTLTVIPYRQRVICSASGGIRINNYCTRVQQIATIITMSLGGWGGVLPDKRLMGMCCWMGSHFHDWIDYNGVAFSTELLEWGRTFSDLLG